MFIMVVNECISKNVRRNFRQWKILAEESNSVNNFFRKITGALANDFSDLAEVILNEI
jgi:hypothetical protein